MDAARITLPMVSPMLAKLGRLPHGAGWAFEMKFDGVRAISYVQGGVVRVLSRNDNDVSRSYPELIELGRLFRRRAVILDGEIVTYASAGRPDFGRLQRRMHAANPSGMLLWDVPVTYLVFDLLHLDGRDLTSLPYIGRRDLLAGLGLAGDHVRVPANYCDADGETVLRAAELAGLEGIVAKRLAAPYRSGKRSAEWTKVPLIKTQEVVIIGWKPGEGRRAGMIGSLLLAVSGDRDELTFAGNVGTGFTDSALRMLQQQLAPLGRATPAVSGVPREHARYAYWVEPVLVGEVEYRNWTPDGRLRHPSWRGLRADRTPPVRRAPEPVSYPSQGEVVAALQTRDGKWRVEGVKRGSQRFFRLSHDDNVVDGLNIGDVERLLGADGIAMDELIDAPTGAKPGRPGAA